MALTKELILVNPDKCVGCNACVRNCPAQEANITKQLEDGRFVTTVNHDRCIRCGECVRTCQHGARDFEDDTEEFIKFIEKGNKAALLVAPAVKTVFPDSWKGVLDFFRGKGVKIYDVSMGADICTWAHLRAIEQNKVKNIITQPCAAIVNYIETYQPGLVPNLSPVHSPVSCEAVYLQKYLHVNVPLAMLSPCIAKKTEFEETGLIQYNVTFGKLKEYFSNNKIRIPTNSEDDYAYSFDDQQGQVGAVYPRPGGLRDNLWIHNPELNITNSEGVHKVYPELDMYAKMPEFKHPEVFDVLSCEYGCNVGPAADTNSTTFDIMATMRDVEKFARKNRKAGLFGRGEDKLFKKFDELFTLGHFMRTYSAKKATPVPTAAQLENVFRSMGKFTEKDRHYDCHACGYHSCYEMATAIYRGLNVPDNCIIHAKSVLNERHKDLSEQHEKLFTMAEECKHFSDELVKDIDVITNNMNTISEATSKTGEKSKIVNSLMENLISFCSGYDHMDSDTVAQLTKILTSIATAFKSLDENVEASSQGATAINDSVVELTRLVEELNVMLHETTHVDNKY